MYKFTDTTPATDYDFDVPAESILINNIPLERQVDGFTTLNVVGREATPQKVTSQDIDGQDGSLFIESKYPTREITVKFRILTATNEEFRRSFELLNYYLSPNQLVFGFNDDKEYQYTGTVTGVGSVPEGRNTAISTFTITCYDPFKYKVKPSIYTSTSTSVVINEPIIYPTLPDEIAVTFTSTATTLTVKTGSQTLTFNGSFKANDVLTIRPKDDNQILLNGVPNADLMIYTSPLEIFKVKENSAVSSSVGAITVKVRDKRL